MTRARKAGDTAPDGMSLIALMPFPALNPLNWWALASPANALNATLHNTQMALSAWRAGADGMRAMLRAQQDSMLAMVSARAPAEAEAADAPAETAQEADSAAVAAEFARPMLEMTRAYGRVGKAFIVAQRDTMRALAGDSQPH